MSNKPILCLDFDGVIHSYTSGWHGATEIPDPPVPGALDFIRRASVQFDVVIHSSRARYPGAIDAMRTWLWSYAQEGADIALWAGMEIAAEKPAAMVTIDDRAITFTGIWPDLDVLLKFRPWNKQEEPTR